MSWLRPIIDEYTSQVLTIADQCYYCFRTKLNFRFHRSVGLGACRFYGGRGLYDGGLNDETKHPCLSSDHWRSTDAILIFDYLPTLRLRGDYLAIVTWVLGDYSGCDD